MARKTEGVDSKTARRYNLLALERDHRSLANIERVTEGDVKASYLSQIKGGRGMGDQVARTLEQRLGLGRGWMDKTHEDDAQWVAAVSGMAPAAGRVLHEAAARLERESSVIDVPYFENPGGMGGGVERQEADLLAGHLPVNLDWVRQNLPHITSPKNLNLMVGSGDSMDPTIRDGDPILIDRGVKEVRVDAIYVFILANEVYIKTLQKIPGDGVRVISDNKKYDPYVINAANHKTDDFEILAKVCWVWNGRKL